MIRLSKQYLPGMAAGYNHPKVKVHVGDGFKFLDDYKNSFDVIITDSSDPEGPAESLFQKPYFKLLHDALRDGGVITTQGCTFPLSFDPRKMLTQANSVPGPSQASCLEPRMRLILLINKTMLQPPPPFSPLCRATLSPNGQHQCQLFFLVSARAPVLCSGS